MHIDDATAAVDGAKKRNGSEGNPPGWMIDDDPRLVDHPGAKTATVTPPPVDWLDGETIFDKPEPVPFVCSELYLCPGRHFQLQGYGYSGKTVAAMALALAVATGGKVWGQFLCHQGLVGHIDHEQGRRATKRRYLRLARAMGINPGDLKGRLKILCLPEMRLSDAQAEAWLIRETAGMALCVIDSLRATILGCDENDSAIREFLDKLLRVSEATGCTFVMIHHAGKGRGEGDQREAGRGSSAIYDSAGTVLKLTVVDHDEAQVTIAKVTMTKSTADADGGALEPFYLRIEDVYDDEGTDAKWGLRCAYKTDQQIHPPVSRAQQKRTIEDLLLAAIREEQGQSTTSLLSTVTGDDKAKRAGLEALERRKVVRTEPGPRRAVFWFSVEPAAANEADDD